MRAKRQLLVPALPRIQDIVDSLGFLGYSTQLRNTAYLLQLREFLLSISQVYEIYGGLGVAYQYNILRITSDILEILLFCALTQKRLDLQNKRGGARGTHLAQTAKKHNLITKPTAKTVERIVSHRNDLHPDRQVELHVKVDPVLFDETRDIVDTVVAELRQHFDAGADESASFDEHEECPYCHAGILELEIGEVCPGCGDPWNGT
jgi:hypothetical protein